MLTPNPTGSVTRTERADADSGGGNLRDARHTFDGLEFLVRVQDAAMLCSRKAIGRSIRLYRLINRGRHCACPPDVSALFIPV